MRRELLAAAVVLAAMACGSTDLVDVAAPLDAPATTSTTTTTTIPAPPLSVGPGETLVATSKVEEIYIRAELPEPATPAVELVDRATFAPVSTGPRADVPLPSVDLGAGHRYLVEGGWVIQGPTDYGNPVVFPVTAQRGYWLQVQVPVRPAGQEGWVWWGDVDLGTIDTSVEVSLSARRLRAVKAGQTIAETPVAIGAAASPTPTGRYFVTDDAQRDPQSSYGPWVLALSGFSQAMDHFSDGAPIIALHGTNRPELLGSAASNGCLRLPNDVITRLREALPLGTPVNIRP